MAVKTGTAALRLEAFAFDSLAYNFSVHPSVSERHSQAAFSSLPKGLLSAYLYSHSLLLVQPSPSAGPFSLHFFISPGLHGIQSLSSS